MDVARGDRVLDGAGDVPFTREPGAGPPVQVGDGVRRQALELADEQAAEQVVVAEPAPLAVERDHEQVRALELEQHLRAVAALGDRVGQRAAEAFEDRRAHQQLPHLARLAQDDSVPEVVDEVAVVDRQVLEEGLAIVRLP